MLACSVWLLWSKKNRVLELYAFADGKAEPAPGDPTVIICMDEFGPLNLMPSPGKQRATYKRPHGVRRLLAGYDLSSNKLYRHVTKREGRTEFLAFCRHLRSLHPAEVRIAMCWTTSART